jgi:hypothetical protein
MQKGAEQGRGFQAHSEGRGIGVGGQSKFVDLF